MATLWDIITNNSSLPVQAGNTFWDHLNNQNQGSGSGVDKTYYSPFKSSIKNVLQSEIVQVLSSSISNNNLNSSVINYTESKVSK